MKIAASCQKIVIFPIKISGLDSLMNAHDSSTYMIFQAIYC